MATKFEVRTRSGGSILIDATGDDDRTILGRIGREIERAPIDLEEDISKITTLLYDVIRAIERGNVKETEITLGIGLSENGRVTITRGTASANFIIRVLKDNSKF
jgi:hypothetical protein